MRQRLKACFKIHGKSCLTFLGLYQDSSALVIGSCSADFSLSAMFSNQTCQLTRLRELGALNPGLSFM